MNIIDLFTEWLEESGIFTGLLSDLNRTVTNENLKNEPFWYIQKNTRKERQDAVDAGVGDVLIRGSGGGSRALNLSTEVFVEVFITGSKFENIEGFDYEKKSIVVANKLQEYAVKNFYYKGLYIITMNGFIDSYRVDGNRDSHLLSFRVLFSD